ncbi:hypothetical protein [Candidatus Synechococcus spongiarum]|uniref:hypothetical protein n=1 Tax=Candidatus Synechococcus spongiarum TaxID=431041 RepID=UPI0012697614|nr:hypothetical protein [Candidatus Synechococcus spongiarum]
MTELGRHFGISAVHCGHHLSQAGLRDNDGLPLPQAIDQGYAYKRPEQNANRSVLWNYDHCSGILRQHGLNSVEEQRLVEQWADLLEALHVGSPAILLTPQEMADSDMPHHIRDCVNRRLAARGSQLRISKKDTQAGLASGTEAAVGESEAGNRFQENPLRMYPLAAA